MRKWRAAVVTICAAGTLAGVGAIGQETLPAADQRLVREILQELVEIPTTEADAMTVRAAEGVAARLIAAGWSKDDVRVLGPNPRVGNVVARLRGTDAGAKAIVLMAHIDVVPARREDWSFDPFKLTERDGWLYGRGTTDNKAGAATLIANFVRLKREGWRPRRDLIMVLTGDEETSGESIQWLFTEHRPLVDAELALNTDSGSIITKNGRETLFTIQASEKVYADYQLEVTDVGGHSSLARPDNPITTLAGALVRLGAHAFPLSVTDVARLFFERSAAIEQGTLAEDMRAVAKQPPDTKAAARLSQSPFYNARLRTTCVATMLQGGHANNALPQLARAVVNCRILPGADPNEVEATVRELAGPKVKVTVLTPPTPSPPSPVTTPTWSRFERIVAKYRPGLPVAPVMEAGATDGLHVRRAGIPTYGISALPEDPEDVRAHGKDERVSIEALHRATAFWYTLMKEFGESEKR
jgi:acetylornithine deacetylase/succinyl-diaminopimelate desuccinylase-like protein